VIECEFREENIEAPCLRCKNRGKRCGEKIGSGRVSYPGHAEGGHNALIWSQRGAVIRPCQEQRRSNFEAGRRLAGMKPGVLQSPDPVIVERITSDNEAVTEEAVRILRDQYCETDESKIISVVHNVLFSFGGEPKQRESSPAPTNSTAPKSPARSMTP
jgi:hypothetical protein